MVRNILQLNTSGVIICHTHPEGIASPSQNDISFTKQLSLSLQTLDIKLLDHIILSYSGNFSFLNEGLLDEYKQQANVLLNSRLSNFETEYTKDK